MIERLDYVSINGPAIASMAKAKNDMPSIDRKLRAVIELRVSQINGCAYCVDLHTREARQAGETTQRLDCLTVWREVTFFDDAEKAALEWAEAITSVATNGAPEHLYNSLSEHFSEQEVVDLTLIVAQMNAWNRLAISFGHGDLSQPKAAIGAAAANGSFVPVDSMDRRNTLLELLRRSLVLQGFSWPFIELSGDGAEFGLAVGGHVDAAREVLAQKPVGVLVASSLPG